MGNGAIEAGQQARDMLLQRFYHEKDTGGLRDTSRPVTSMLDVVQSWRERVIDERAIVDSLLQEGREMGDLLAWIYNRVQSTERVGADDLCDEIERHIADHLAVIAPHTNDLPVLEDLPDTSEVRHITVIDILGGEKYTTSIFT